MLFASTEGTQGLENPVFEYYTLRDAALWYVGGDMCDLLDSAATQLNDDVPLTRSLMPDYSGFVVFEKALSGLDAENLGVGKLLVGGMVWGPAHWPDGTPLLGITVYGPVTHSPNLIPLGSLVWPLGRTTDDPLDDMGQKDHKLTSDQVASMAEDRRRLLALWFLSTQPGLATTTHQVERAAARRAQRAGRTAPSVRVVRLRQRPPQQPHSLDESGRTYHYQWTVSGHWRNQAVGPQWSGHRRMYINPYLKGPEDAPLVKTPKVKAWIR
jgi:hypothetical protein